MTFWSHLHNLWSRAICQYRSVSMLRGHVPVLNLASSVLDPRSSRMAFPQGLFLPMTLGVHCKYLILTRFGRPWIAVVVLICQDGLQHYGKSHWLSPGASIVVQTGQPYRTYVKSPWYPGITIAVHSGPNHGPTHSPIQIFDVHLVQVSKTCG